MRRTITHLAHFAVWCVAWSGTSAAVVATASDLRLVEAVKNQDGTTARALLVTRVDVNGTEPDGATALHWAAHWDDVAAADLLIRAGARVSVANDYGATALMVACQNGTRASAPLVERLLMAGANPNDQLPSGATVLMTAAFAGNVDVVRALLAHGAQVNAKESTKGQTALMWAASERHLDVVRTLVDHGADVNARSQGQFTPLLFAARMGDIDLARVLLAAGADLEAKAADGSTPLLVATIRGHVDLARALLDAGADPNTESPGFTALHWVAGKWESVGSVSYVHSASEWASLIGIPAEKGQLDLMKALLAHGANPNARLTRNVFARGTVAGGVSRPPAFSATGATPFWLAARSGDVAAMRLLLAHGADPLLTAKDGTTPLIAAAGDASLTWKRPGIDTLVPEESRIDAVKLTLQLGSDLNAANAQGNTALHAGALSGFEAVVSFLLAQGAKLNLRNNVGDTPLKAAEGYGSEVQVWEFKNVADILRKAGGVDRPGPPAPYEGISADWNLELRTLLETRADLMNKIEALELRKVDFPAMVDHAMLNKLQTDLAGTDEALKRFTETTTAVR